MNPLSLPNLALSTCWNAERHSEGKPLIEEIATLGFSSVEIGHNTRFSLWPGILQAAQEKIINVISLHNFCPLPVEVLRPSPNCYKFTDSSFAARQRAINATIDTLNHAAEIGASKVVLHLGDAGKQSLSHEMELWFDEGDLFCKDFLSAKRKAVVKRRKQWNLLWDRIKSCLDPITQKAEELKIQLGIESRSSFEEIPNQEEITKILEAYPLSVLGYWHDFGHSARQEYLGWQDQEEQLSLLKQYIIGAHVQDCLPPNHDHLPLGHGHLNFDHLFSYLPPTAACVLEVDPVTTSEQLIESLDLWKNYAATAVS